MARVFFKTLMVYAFAGGSVGPPGSFAGRPGSTTPSLSYILRQKFDPRSPTILAQVLQPGLSSPRVWPHNWEMTRS